jgi:TonB-dependent SusC/RagA subfamily outer membrane receptor
MISNLLSARINRISKLLLPMGLIAIGSVPFPAHATNVLTKFQNLRKAEITVTGIVTDSQGQALPGVNVYEKQTKKGTVTDANGRYSITLQDDAILMFSYIGYSTKEISVNNKTVLNITLASESNDLDDVVVIGYQKIRKSDVTGAISSVKAAELNLTSPTIGQALVGKVAGVQVAQTSGAPYSSTKIRVRGIGSINASSDPLYVIDGYPSGNNVSINPEDIESIDILKDAASAAIYGSRASGGVVMITTKRGKISIRRARGCFTTCKKSKTPKCRRVYSATN